MSGSTLLGARFVGANVAGVSFFDTTTRGFTQAQLVSTASYQAKELRGIGLSSNDLTGWDLRGQNLINANLTASILTGTNFSQADLRGALTNHLLGGFFAEYDLADRCDCRTESSQQ